MNRFISSPHDLLARLQFRIDIQGQELLRWQERHGTLLKQGIKRYFFGKGHPYKDRVSGFVSEERIQSESDDELLRCLLFIEELSGVRCLPPKGQKFQVSEFLY